MKQILASILLFVGLALNAQTNIINVPVADYTGTGQTNFTVTFTLLSPNPRTVNNLLITQKPMVKSSGNATNVTFTNVIWGKYRCEVSDSTVTPYTFYVGTNTLGTVQIASLITNSAALPPNPATNYYTQAQVDALVTAAATTSGVSGWTVGATGSDSTNPYVIINYPANFWNLRTYSNAPYQPVLYFQDPYDPDSITTGSFVVDSGSSPAPSVAYDGGNTNRIVLSGAGISQANATYVSDGAKHPVSGWGDEVYIFHPLPSTVTTNTGVLQLGNLALSNSVPKPLTNFVNYGNGAIAETTSYSGDYTVSGVNGVGHAFFDAADGHFLYAALGYDDVSNGSLAGQFALLGYATQPLGNLCGSHVINTRISGDNRTFVFRGKDPAGNGTDGGGYNLFETRYKPSSPDSGEGVYANWLLSDEYGNVAIGQLGQAVDAPNSTWRTKFKVGILGSTAGNYPAFGFDSLSGSYSIGTATSGAFGFDGTSFYLSPASTWRKVLIEGVAANGVNLTNVSAARLATSPSLTNATIYGSATATNWFSYSASGQLNTNSGSRIGRVMNLATGKETFTGTNGSIDYVAYNVSNNTATFSGNGAGLTNIPSTSIISGMTTNLQFTFMTTRTNTLYFTNGILMRVTQP